jgi:hypothetical protein
MIIGCDEASLIIIIVVVVVVIIVTIIISLACGSRSIARAIGCGQPLLRVLVG